MTTPPTTLHVVKDPLPPGTEEWARTVTASKIAAIVGVSHYKSPYATWHEMNGLKPPQPTPQLQDRWHTGHAMELALREFWLRKHPGWRMSRGEVQCYNPDIPFPNRATLDSIATPDGKKRTPKNSHSVQFKTVSDYQQFIELSQDNIPEEWVIQVIWEMHTSGLIHNPAHLVVCGPYYKWIILEIHYDRELAELLEAKVVEFLATLNGNPPTPTLPADADIPRRVYPGLNRGENVVIPEELAVQWDALKKREKAMNKDKRAFENEVKPLTAQVQELMGEAETATTPDGYVVAKRTPYGKSIRLNHQPLGATND